MNGTLIALFTVLAVFLPLCGHASAGKSPIEASQSSTRKSISAWVTCTGVSDDTQGVARAFNAARHSSFTLIVDCPVRLHIGMDIARTIFIDDGTAVEFTGAGKFIVDNVLHPAFVIANSSNILLKNWNLEYDGSLPVNPKTGGYEDSGKFVASNATAPPAGAFNDGPMTRWLSTHRAITFDRRRGPVTSIWVGPTNTSAVFFLSGDTSRVTVTGMRVYVPNAAGGERFVPVVFSLSANFKSNQTVTSTTPRTAQYAAIPHDLTFSDIDLDGTYMGWQGNAQTVIFDKIRSHRYGDLQDADGENVGGIGKWFAPPHLFYLNYATNVDPELYNTNLRIHDVVDSGPRVGVARDRGGSDTTSGFAESIKIGGVDCSVDQYTSSRPDGFIDVLSSDGLTVSNVNATYDSSFLNNLFSGWRFPNPPYKNVIFKNIVFKDLAASSVVLPVSGANQESNEGIVFSNVHVEVNHWAGKGLPLPAVAGRRNDVVIHFKAAEDKTRMVSAQKGTISVVLQATPMQVGVGGATVLKWAAKRADSCSASGAWEGTVAATGTRTVHLTTSGDQEFALDCSNSVESVNTTVRVSAD